MRRALLALTLAACTRARPPLRTAAMDARPAPTVPADASVDAPREVASDTPSVPPSLEAVVEAVRRIEHREAWDLAAALPADAQRTREVRYLRARLALLVDRPAEAIPLTEGLAELLPALRIDVLRLRAQALARSDRHAEARAAFERLAAEGGSARDRSAAVLEAVAAGDATGVLPALRGWATTPPAGIGRARAWRTAAEALERAGERDAAVACWRRLAVDEPDDAHAPDALAALSRLNAPLSPELTLTRAANLLERARQAEAIATLEAMPPGPARTSTRRQHLLGRALYAARGRYAEAHVALREASRDPNNEHRGEDAFLSARSLARADRDDESVRAFDEVARVDRGRWGHEAAFRAAWLNTHHANRAVAIERFQRFLRERIDAPARLRVEAAWHLGWALLESGRHREAAEALDRSAELATHHLERGRGRYWAAVARKRLGDRDGAVAGWQGLIAHRPLTWYALLAESRLRAEGVEVPTPAPPPVARAAPAITMPAAARWLHALGFDHDAADLVADEESRLRGSVPSDRADEAMAALWTSLGEARRAFVLSSRHADQLDDLPTEATRWIWDAGFPRPHAPRVEAAEDEQQLPRHYLFAIMRQESAFNDRDVSSARAIGLLQMIPPTTRRVAQTLGLPFREELLFQPAYNIRVGAGTSGGCITSTGRCSRGRSGRSMPARAPWGAGCVSGPTRRSTSSSSGSPSTRRAPTSAG
ncbi:MAG: transglycosylase SLT domain-containing protein [Polyangiales bacterium]